MHKNKEKIDLLAFWFDVYSGEVYMFSVEEKCFVKIDEKTYKKLSNEYGKTKLDI